MQKTNIYHVYRAIHNNKIVYEETLRIGEKGHDKLWRATIEAYEKERHGN